MLTTNAQLELYAHTSLFFRKRLCTKGVQRVTCLTDTSPNRSLNTSLSCRRILFCVATLNQKKSEVFGEVLSEMFLKHLTLRNAVICWWIQEKSEVVMKNFFYSYVAKIS